MTKRISIFLDAPGRAIVFVLMILVPASVFAVTTVRFVLAKTWGDRSKVRDIQRAISIQPTNAEHHYWLAMVYLLSGEGTPADAVSEARKAVDLNPNYARYWIELGKACLAVSDLECSERSFSRALELAPNRPSIEWETATYFAVTGNEQKAFPHLRRLLEMQPEHVREVSDLTWRAFGHPETVWPNVMRPLQNVAVKAAYLEFLVEKRRFEQTGEYWKQLAADGLPKDTSFESVRPYLESLMLEQQYGLAKNVWLDLLNSGVIRTTADHSRELSQNLVYNAAFAQPILNTGFDWRLRNESYVVVQFPANSSSQPLEIDFTVGHNSEDEPIKQLIPVSPNEQYVLTANASSEAITSDSGPRLRVVDASCPTCLDVATEGTVGTTPSHPVKVAFSTGPQTHFVNLSIWRAPSRTYPMDISGKAWFDGISLRQVQENKLAQPTEVSAARD